MLKSKNKTYWIQKLGQKRQTHLLTLKNTTTGGTSEKANEAIKKKAVEKGKSKKNTPEIKKKTKEKSKHPTVKAETDNTTGTAVAKEIKREAQKPAADPPKISKGWEQIDEGDHKYGGWGDMVRSPLSPWLGSENEEAEEKPVDTSSGKRNVTRGEETYRGIAWLMKVTIQVAITVMTLA
jgi:hypothetical protein